MSTPLAIAVPLAAGLATLVLLIASVDSDLLTTEWVPVVTWSVLVAILVLAAVVDALGLLEAVRLDRGRSSFGVGVIVVVLPLLLFFTMVGWGTLGGEVWMFTWVCFVVALAVLAVNVSLVVACNRHWARTQAGRSPEPS